jgi:hypothetical protein
MVLGTRFPEGPRTTGTLLFGSFGKSITEGTPTLALYPISTGTSASFLLPSKTSVL